MNNKYANAGMVRFLSIIVFGSSIMIGNYTKSDNILAICGIIIVLSIATGIVSAIRRFILSRRIKKELKAKGFSV